MRITINARKIVTASSNPERLAPTSGVRIAAGMPVSGWPSMTLSMTIFSGHGVIRKKVSDTKTSAHLIATRRRYWLTNGQLLTRMRHASRHESAARSSAYSRFARESRGAASGIANLANLPFGEFSSVGGNDSARSDLVDSVG